MRRTFPFVVESAGPKPGWRAWPANALTLTNLGAGALVCWWAASEFDLGWAPAEWLDSIGLLDGWMALLGEDQRRVAGLYWLLAVWMFGQLCDVLDGGVARAMRADGRMGAMLDSMADLVSSGLAPAFVGMALIMEWGAQGLMPDGTGWLTILPLTVMMAAAWRLARFSLGAMEPPAREMSNRFDFEGLPAPFAAVYWAGIVWSWSRCGDAGCEGLWVLGLLGSSLLPLGMVSRLPQVGFKHWGSDRLFDILRLIWLSVVVSLCLAMGGLGLVLALISYPLFGAAMYLAPSAK